MVKEICLFVLAIQIITIIPFEIFNLINRFNDMPECDWRGKRRPKARTPGLVNKFTRPGAVSKNWVRWPKK